MRKINTDYEVIITRSETGFDKACDHAYARAVMMFDIDEYGHSSMDGWQRSICSIHVEFMKYLRQGNDHNYIFNVKAVRYEDSDE